MPGQGWVLALTSVASFMVSLDTQVVATALPVIRVHLHASLGALEWTVNAYTLSFAVLLLTGAALGERLGRRRVLAAGVGLFTVASAGGALGLVWALVRANGLGWASPEIVMALVAGAVLTGASIGWELRAAQPMVPLRLFRSRAYSAGNAACLCVFAVLFGLVFFMAQF